MTTLQAVLALLGLALGALVLLVVGWLLERVHRPMREILRYADDTLAAGLGIAGNLDGVDELARTRDLGGTLVRYVEGAS